MLSMIEKIKAAGLNKTPLGDTPLNLTAMLENNGGSGQNGHEGESEGENSRSGMISPYDSWLK